MANYTTANISTTPGLLFPSFAPTMGSISSTYPVNPTLNMTTNNFTIGTTRKPRYFKPFQTFPAEPYLGELSKDYTMTDVYILIVIELLLELFIIGGNAMVIAAVCKFRRLRRVTNLFIVSLAVSDLLVGIFMPLTLISTLYPNADLFKDIHMCLLPFCAIIMLCCASIANLLAVAVDRFIAIKMAFHYREIMTRKRASILIVCCWLLAGVSAAIAMVWKPSTFKECDFKEVVYENYLLIVTYGIALPMVLVITGIYLFLYRVAKRHARTIDRQERWKFPAGFRRPSLTREKKTAVTILIVVGVFMICWLPYFVFLSVETLCKEGCNMNKILRNALAILGFSNSCANPIIYAFRTKEFQKAFRTMLCCKQRLADRLHHSSTFRSSASLIRRSEDEITQITPPDSRKSSEASSPFKGRRESAFGPILHDIPEENKIATLPPFKQNGVINGGAEFSTDL